MAEKDIDTLNRYMVSITGSFENIAIMNPPRGPISKDDALALAAWLVALADSSPGHTRFAAFLAAVEAT